MRVFRGVGRVVIVSGILVIMVSRPGLLVECVSREKSLVEKGEALDYSSFFHGEPDPVWCYLHSGPWREPDALEESVEVMSVAGDSREDWLRVGHRAKLQTDNRRVSLMM